MASARERAALVEERRGLGSERDRDGLARFGIDVAEAGVTG